MTNTPIRVAFPDAPLQADACGCCNGTELATLKPTPNRPNLSAVEFRVGDHGSFKASMLTGLASAAHPALNRLRTREDDDFSIALIDAWASACDVLTFYQERLANEAYMGTALERLSVSELARLIGYRLHPGAAAETDLIITLEDPPAAAPDVTELEVPSGTRVQSQPGPGETALTFETIEPLTAQVAWNALRPRLSVPRPPVDGDAATWVAGIPTLAVGDAIVFVARERWDENFSGFDLESPRYDFRRITSVETQADGSRTRITWDADLDSLNNGMAPTPGLKMFHLKDRASLFGYNAPHPLVLSSEVREQFGFNDTSNIDTSDWDFDFSGTRRIDLDAIYKAFVADSWIVMQRPTGLTQVYRIETARDDARADWAVSGKAHRLTLDTDRNLSSFAGTYRENSIYGGSTEIEFAETPLSRWVGGKEVETETRLEGLPEGRRLIFRGARARMRVLAQSLTLTDAEDTPHPLGLGDTVILLDEPKEVGDGSLSFQCRIIATDVEGTVTATQQDVEVLPALQDAEQIAVAAVLAEVQPVDARHSRLVLEEPLGVAFDRTSLRIHANIARAAHGDGVTDILGHGDPSQPFQKFLLKHAPVTHRLAPTETGVESTLSVRVDGVEWDEVPDLYDRGATARVYKTSITEDGATVVEFGDGHSGARPTPGRDNIQATHSRGLGAAGNLKPGQIKLPIDRPLGMKGAENPLPATGGADPEKTEDARHNAGLYTLTLGRVVSLTDYRDFALGYPGIAKAEARWVWQGDARRIVVTVAGEGGAPVTRGAATYDNLLGAFRALGDPLVGVDLLDYVPARFRLALKLRIDPAYDRDTVLAATEAHLHAAFSFDAARFGAVLSLSDVAAAVHQVAGVQAVDIDNFYRTTSPQDSVKPHPRLFSEVSRQEEGVLLPAELLMLDPGPLDALGEMT